MEQITNVSIPRIVIAGASGGSGKTLLSLGLIRVLVRRGITVAPFKKGPDYIDATWMSHAAKRDCTNLDLFFMTSDHLRNFFIEKALKSDIAIIEGNRGLYDGVDESGSCSTAELSRILRSSIILTLNCSKMTRTAVALISGMTSFEKGLDIAGVVLSRTGSVRHEEVLRKFLELSDLHLPQIVGMLRRLPNNPIKERHMGLTFADGDVADDVIEYLADFVENSVNVDEILKIARNSQPLPYHRFSHEYVADVSRKKSQPIIGVVKDIAFWFIYPQNIKALEDAGAKIVYLSFFDEKPWQKIDGLYLPGGFPELWAEKLASSQKVKNLLNISISNMPIFAECGGYMILCRNMIVNGVAYPMAGVFQTDVEFLSAPQGLGYVYAKVIAENPFFPQNFEFKGHEFHYSKNLHVDYEKIHYCLELKKGIGMGFDNGKIYDGLFANMTFASYTHIFAPAVPHWAENFVRSCSEYRNILKS